MRIVEILLPRNTRDRDLSSKTVSKIGVLQQRMDLCVDKIMSPGSTPAAKEFLKSRLRSDYCALRELLPTAMAETEDTRYEVYDRKSGDRVSGPYASRNSAIKAANKKDLEHGAIKYGYRPVKSLNEAIHKLPLTDKDFELVKKLMERPIPAAIAPIYISEIIEDDDFYAELKVLEDSEPGRDIRPLIAEWFKRVMPDQLHRFTGSERTDHQRKGLLSVIHGYDPHQYHGTNDPITGNAYGRR